MRTVLDPGDVLPLTCTRTGTCCHGKDIRITPWELAVLALAAGRDSRGFREAFTVDAGARLRVDGPPGWRGQAACSQYDPARGCSVHAARPLACRLYPLGRERQGDQVRIIHEGRAFPCLDGCPEVATLPRLTVASYLDGQGVAPFAAARDAYLEMAQDLAEAALVLVVDGGLCDGTDRRWRQAWRMAVDDGPPAWPALLGSAWHDTLTAPRLMTPPDDGAGWVAEHAAALQDAAGCFADPAVAGVRLLTAAVLLMHAVGGDVREVGGRWLGQAGV